MSDGDAPDRQPSEWHVLTPDGEAHDPHEYDADPGLRAVVADEVGNVDGPTSEGGESAEPPHVRLMQEKELADYEPLSDPGNLRYYPKGKLVRDLLMDYVTDLVVDHGGMPVETPVMYDLDDEAIGAHAARFGERQYRFSSGDRRMMLRFAACFGQFSIMRDMHLPASDLPLKIYEMSTYTFRREQRGEVSGLRRLRGFTMPDMHTAARDEDGAKAELRRQIAFAALDDLGISYVPIVRVTEDFRDRNPEWVESVVADLGEPALVEVLPERHHYWSAKADLAVVDGIGRPFELATIQLDVESAERFEITYVEDGEKHHPSLLHYSPSGGIERVMCALLEGAAEMAEPRLPTWLSPTQVRLIPVDGRHRDDCERMADDLEARGIRVDVDDRSESVGKRVARAESDWVPYYAVVGDREVDGAPLEVTVRGGPDRELSADDLREAVLDDVGDLPTRRRYLPRRVSRQPRFVGG